MFMLFGFCVLLILSNVENLINIWDHFISLKRNRSSFSGYGRNFARNNSKSYSTTDDDEESTMMIRKKESGCESVLNFWDSSGGVIRSSNGNISNWSETDYPDDDEEEEEEEVGLQETIYRVSDKTYMLSHSSPGTMKLSSAVNYTTSPCTAVMHNITSTMTKSKRNDVDLLTGGNNSYSVSNSNDSASGEKDHISSSSRTFSTGSYIVSDEEYQKESWEMNKYQKQKLHNKK